MQEKLSRSGLGSSVYIWMFANKLACMHDADSASLVEPLLEGPRLRSIALHKGLSYSYYDYDHEDYYQSE